MTTQPVIDPRRLNLYRVSLNLGKLTISQIPEPYKTELLKEQTVQPGETGGQE